MSNSKRLLYVGGLADEVDMKLLKTTFSAFGDIVDVNLPMDYTTQKHKGFAFIEYQWPEDAADAMDNMDNGEILNKTIRVNLARPQRFQNLAGTQSAGQETVTTSVDENPSEMMDVTDLQKSPAD